MAIIGICIGENILLSIESVGIFCILISGSMYISIAKYVLLMSKPFVIWKLMQLVE